MAIAYKSQGAGAGTESSGASLDLVCPATVDPNDILIAHVLHTGTTTGPSTPANWSLLYGPANVGTTATARHWCFGKLAVGNEDGATIGFGTDGGTNGRAGRIYSFSGYSTGSLADVVPAASFSDIPHATDPQGPSVTTTVAGALAIACFCQDDNNTGAAISGMTGGTWVENVAEYSNATWGPQGIVLYINSCTPTADPGTVSGGAQVATNDEAGTIGFEIRPNAPTAQDFPQTIAATQTGLATATKLTAFNRSMATTQLGAVAVVTALSIGQSIGATVVALVTLTILAAFAQSFAAAVLGVVAMQRAISHTIGAVAISTATVVREIGKQLTAVVLGIVTLDAQGPQGGDGQGGNALARLVAVLLHCGRRRG